MNCASTSLPTPLSPVIRTLAPPTATRRATSRMARIASLSPMKDTDRFEEWSIVIAPPPVGKQFGVGGALRLRERLDRPGGMRAQQTAPPGAIALGRVRSIHRVAHDSDNAARF